MSNHELINNLRNPETRDKAFVTLVGQFQERIYWHIRKIVIDHDDADDLVQDTFIKVWKNIDKFREESDIYTWIYRISTNECLNFLRKKKNRFFLPIHDVEAELKEKLTNSAHIDGEKIEMVLQEALLTLPTQQRLIFNMRYFDDLKFSEIADILEKSLGAVKANYHHARKKVESHVKSRDLNHEKS
ncbi:DNA-directed RNA polymerase sigma-70 factor [Fulvitalea axinellae]|uniref:RNA polymerase sigma factor n=1 Tax=Fulvitalea axinellae TaxID=1182444 RepID=A0AAU9D5U5_9BACT|nr:DNA-directed RNA polymerase sigma-70 factor [Fulvitalea axinellae]